MQDITFIVLKGCDLVKMWLIAVTSSICDSVILQQCVSHQVDHTDHPS